MQTILASPLLDSVSCASPTVCLALGSQNALLRWEDGGVPRSDYGPSHKWPERAAGNTVPVGRYCMLVEYSMSGGRGRSVRTPLTRGGNDHNLALGHPIDCESWDHGGLLGNGRIGQRHSDRHGDVQRRWGRAVYRPSLTSGKGSCNSAYIASVGTYTISATYYSSDPNFLSSSGKTTLSVTSPPPSPAPAPVSCSQPYGRFLYGSTVVGIAVTHDDRGYWIVNNAGQVAACGDAVFLGQPTTLNKPIVGIAATPDGGGYLPRRIRRWNLHLRRRRLPGFHRFSDAQQAHRRHGRRSCNEGLLVSGLRRRIFAFNAPFLGSTGSIKLNKPVVGMAEADNEAGIGL